MKSRKDFFQMINSFPHSLAIYLTFTLDKAVINKIAEYSNGSNIIILHDYRQGVSLKNNWNNRVVCIPVNTFNQHQQNCFHPKLALLKGDEKAKLLLGSANLSRDAFSKEKEICFEADLDFNFELYNSVIDYIASLIPQTHTSTEVLLNAINKFRFSTEPLQKTTGLKFVYGSENMSIFDHIAKHLQADEQPVLRVASPFLSADFKSEFDNFLAVINPKEIHFYLRKNYPLPETFKSLPGLQLHEPKTRSTRNGFHAKIVSIEYARKEIVFLGSPNFSRQGFFLSLAQGANQECGIIISSTTKNVISDLFNEGWEKPVTAAEWEEDKEALTQSAVLFPEQPYVWAELSGEKAITIFCYLPDKVLVEQVYADDHKLPLKQENPAVLIYSCKHPFKTESIRVTIGTNFSEQITVFNEFAFEERAKEIGDSLFYEPNRIDSIKPPILKEAIERDGIKVKTLGAVVIEPPYLEQYFYNVKNRIAILSKRKFFSDYHVQELKDVLKNISHGEGIYFTLQLYKLFEVKKQNQLMSICKERIKELLEETGLKNNSVSSFENFYKEWKKY
ncbi:MAG: phosphatidylserine/phosphatidylglycerophosphate/cardiolipin synthase family protein [Chitinophagaceae bacterium]|nr:phosphatidylserine/phosphatidylglycerophosphate/cardiolipin synthase family protein [Chitinophagaceae bacterium]